MSYQGYEEFLCESGHHSVCDCWDDPPKTCQTNMMGGTCGKPIVWWNAVDETNGEGEKFRAKLEVEKKATTCSCTTCNHVHVIEAERYKIPADVGHKGTPSSLYDGLPLEEDEELPKVLQVGSKS